MSPYHIPFIPQHGVLPLAYHCLQLTSFRHVAISGRFSFCSVFLSSLFTTITRGGASLHMDFLDVFYDVIFILVTISFNSPLDSHMLCSYLLKVFDLWKLYFPVIPFTRKLEVVYFWGTYRHK